MGPTRFCLIWPIVAFSIAFTAISSECLGQDGKNEAPKARKIVPLPDMGWLRDASISADGKLAFAGDFNRNIWVWDVPNRKVLRAIKDPSNMNQNTSPCYAFSADGKFALVGNQQALNASNGKESILDHETLTFWDLNSGVRLRAFNINGQPVRDVALSPDGKRALSVSLIKTIWPPEMDGSQWFGPKHFYALRLWDTTNGKVVRVLLDDGFVGPLAFSSDGKFFADGWTNPAPGTGNGKDWAIGTWDTQTGNVLGAIEMRSPWLPVAFECIALSPDGRYAAIGSEPGVSMWNLQTGKLVWRDWYADERQIIHKGQRNGLWFIGSLGFSPDGRRLVVSSAAKRWDWGNGITGRSKAGMLVLDSTNGKVISQFARDGEPIARASFTPDGKLLFGLNGKRLTFWDVQSGKEAFSLDERSGSK